MIFEVCFLESSPGIDITFLVLHGHLDVELNDVGRQQAIAVADRLAEKREISAVFISDLKRARDTAHVIESRCNRIEDPEIRERHLGDLQGFSMREAAKLKVDANKASLSSRADQEIPGGGESFDQLFHRCTSSLQKIGRKHKGQRLAEFTHGGVSKAFHKRAAPTAELPSKIQNASISIFEIADEEGWTIKAWGEVGHLSNTGFLETAFGGDGNSG
ncbi:phosphoglycerate mutase-like protein 4 [Hevea brasiliensis]|uniref:phosphoglycerate mutase-like protein 4 n=1 Tax=Hevea brasiliensis TaxID=3981 RepID=UPI0025D60D07|nr:phosphoglycerate mutase-like protein 4 [Hevea brasiliensis]